MVWEQVLNDSLGGFFDELEEVQFVEYAHAMEVTFKLTNPCVDVVKTEIIVT